MKTRRAIAGPLWILRRRCYGRLPYTAANAGTLPASSVVTSTVDRDRFLAGHPSPQERATASRGSASYSCTARSQIRRELGRHESYA